MRLGWENPGLRETDAKIAAKIARENTMAGREGVREKIGESQWGKSRG